MAGTTAINLVSNGSTTGTFGPQGWKGGKIALAVAASAWGTGSVQFQAILPGGGTASVGTAITANTLAQVIELPPCQIQAVVTGATFSGLYVSAIEVPTNVRH